MSARNLHIYAMHYAPEITGNAPYTTSFAEHTVAQGWHVTVETGLAHYPEWKNQHAPAREVIGGVRVSRHRHYVPPVPTAVGRAAMDATWAASVMPAMMRDDADVVVGVVPNLTGGWVARLAARRAGAPWVLWFQDLMGQAAAQSGIAGGTRVAGLVRRTELAAARHADAVIIVAEGYRRYLVDGGVDTNRIHLVRNWSVMSPSSTSRAVARERFGFAPRNVVAVHSGNMGAKQGLDVVLDAAERAPRITFVLQGNGSERDLLEHDATARGLTNVRFLPSLPNEDLADLLTAADVLLLTQRATVTDMSLPSKLTTYFTAGTPIVASVNRASEAAALLSEARRGVAVEPGDLDAFVEAVTTASHQRPAPSPRGEGLFGSPADILGIVSGTLGDGSS